MKRPFTLDDFRKRLERMTRPGWKERVIGFLPGMGDLAESLNDSNLEREMGRIGGMIDAMTPDERVNVKLIDKSRKRRIAKGAGVSPGEVNDLLKQYEAIASMM